MGWAVMGVAHGNRVMNLLGIICMLFACWCSGFPILQADKRLGQEFMRYGINRYHSA
jgi:hypothetical protein